MNPLLMFLLGMHIQGVVDRVEGRFAVVEWDESHLSDLPLSVIPYQVREGQLISLWLKPCGAGAWLAQEDRFLLLSEPGQVYVPAPRSLPPGRYFKGRFKLHRKPTVTSRMLEPRDLALGTSGSRYEAPLAPGLSAHLPAEPAGSTWSCSLASQPPDEGSPP